MEQPYQEARIALTFLETHRIKPNAMNFEFALDLVQRPTTELAVAVKGLLSDGFRLTPDIIVKLQANHRWTRADPAPTELEQSVDRNAQRLGTLANDAQDITQSLQRDVTTMAEVAEGWPSTDYFVQRLTGAERDLADLRAQVAELRVAVAPALSTASVVEGDTDGLTRVLNQQGGRDFLQRLAAEGRPFALMMLSIDGLETINARYGRAVGDNVVNAFATTLRQTFPEGEPIRWAGNAFIVATAELGLAAASTAVDEALASFAARRFKLRGTGDWIGVVTASAGIAAGRAEEGDAVFDRAESNLATAIRSGGNSVHA